MGKTLLGIVASPRKLGNSELFIKALYRNLPGPWELRLIRFPQLNLRTCSACFQCLFGKMQCPQDDDFAVALQALIQCDAYVVASPTYLLGANASLKLFLDRGLSFYAHIEELWGKPAVGVAIAGGFGLEGSTKLNVESFIKLTFGDLRGSAVIYAGLPGEVLLENGGTEAAKRLAKALTEGREEAKPSIPTCTVCGGDTFRFLADGRVRCMLCSSAGSYAWDGSRVKLRTRPGEHPLFLTYEDTKRHAEWLRGTKEMFLARHKELKALARDFAQTGIWVSPKKRGNPT